MTSCILGFNAFGGTLPIEIGLLTNLKFLHLDRTMISGQLPTEIESCTNMIELWFSNSDLSGTIPSGIGLLTKLTRLSWSNVILHGTIPSEIGRCAMLEGLSLYNNSLVGAIPSEIGLLTRMQYFKADNNSLRGTIPSEIGLMSNLWLFDGSANLLSGLLPSEIGRLDLLRRLDLSNTEVSGSIPEAVCEDRYIAVDCNRVACGCCGCGPTPARPLQSDAPSNTHTPTAASSSSSHPSLTSSPSQRNEPGCSPFSPIASMGTQLSLSDKDDGVELVDLPFVFMWPGFLKPTRISVTTNGVVFLVTGIFPFGTVDGCCDPSPIDLGGVPHFGDPRIAVAHARLDARINGSIYASEISSGAFVVSWEGVPFRGDGPENGLNFQVLLYANGKVEMRWGGKVPR